MIIGQPPPGPGSEINQLARRLKRWLLRLPAGSSAALLLAYCLLLAGLLVMSGFGVLGALLTAIILAGSAYGSFRLMQKLQPLSETSPLLRLLYIVSLALSAITTGLAVLTPGLMLFGLLIWGLFGLLGAVIR